MMAQPVPHQPSPDKKRVKVYELRNNDWFDRGTGFCSTTVVPLKDPDQKEARLLVESEDHPERLLLETTITRQDGFQIQQDTLIVWTEPLAGSSNGGTDMALSFQEAEGCAAIWKFVNNIQQSFDATVVGGDDCLSEDMTMDAVTTITLPAAELGNLSRIDLDMRAMSAYNNGRDALAKFIMAEDYIQKLIPLVAMAEDLESVADLHLLCNIMKTILLLNDSGIMEHAMSDACVIGVVGALEYDPDFPMHKANHRTWLSHQGRFKQVVPIQDEHIRRKIHQTYRLQYLKDVVLARILDDPTYSVLNSIIFFNQVEIVQYITANVQLLSELFAIFDEAPNANADAGPKRQRDAVGFIQQCCAIAKSLQPPARQTLYTNLIHEGLIRVILWGIRQPDVGVRVGTADILISVIDHDPNLIRMTMYHQVNNNEPPLTTSLVDLLLIEVDLGVKCHISDAIKILLDPALGSEQPRANGDRSGGPRIMTGPLEPQQDLFIDRFYQEAAARLCKPLLDLEGRTDISLSSQQASMFSYIVDLISYLIKIHHDRTMFFLEQNNITSRVAQLLGSGEKYIQLVAIRFFKGLALMATLATQTGEFYKRHMADGGVLGPVLDVLIKTLPRDNLLGSACLELFETFKKENINVPCIKYLGDNHREKLISLSHLDTFRDIMLVHDRLQAEPASMDFFADTDDDTPRRPSKPNTRFMEQLTVDPVEEAYMDSIDDDDNGDGDKTPATNGMAAAPRPLVDYTSDEDGDENADGDEAAASQTGQSTTSSEDEGGLVAASATSPQAPPERIAEKRRREEEDEDGFGSLMQDKKRRNNAAANANAALGGVARPRRTSTSLGRGSGAAPKKIQIQLSATLKARTEAADGGS